MQRWKRLTLMLVILAVGGSLGYLTRMENAHSQSQPRQPAQVSPTPQQDTTIIPGDRVGPVTRKTTRAELARLYGKATLSDRTIAGAEGIGSFPVTGVNLGPQRSFTVVWKDEKRTEAIAVRELGTAWKTPEGLRVGLPLAQLRQILGEFQLYGLAWDYSGTVRLEQTRLAK